MENNFEKYLISCVNKYADNQIKEAMLYCLDGGKRFRPNLIYSICEDNNVDESKILPAAAAIEFIQTYSLIHDDLPEMDNDDFRRGKPSCHKAFGSDVAVLTGDALLTHAFSCIADDETINKNGIGIKLIKDLANYSGLKGMIYGQLLDIKAHDLDEELLFKIEDNKTSGLFKFCCLAAMHIMNLDNYAYFEELGSKIGVIFQKQDDLFDAIKTEEEMGKSLSDEKNDKLTALKFKSVEELSKEIDNLFIDLDNYLIKAPFNPNGLKKLLNKMAKR